jgi:hypothetical protein
MAIELLRSFLQQATATGARSTVLTDLRWFIGLIAAALLIASKYETTSSIIIVLSSILTLASLLYIAAYIYFAIRSPDALRSEKFTLSKMAIEKSITGDNLSGLIDPATSQRQLSPSVTQKEDV